MRTRRKGVFGGVFWKQRLKIGSVQNRPFALSKIFCCDRYQKPATASERESNFRVICPFTYTFKKYRYFQNRNRPPVVLHYRPFVETTDPKRTKRDGSVM